MTNSVKFSMPFIDVGQSQKEITHNEAIALIDILLLGAAESIETAPPGSPSNGKIVLVAPSGTSGDFVGLENCIAYWLDDVGAWRYIYPVAEQQLRIGIVTYRYTGGGWVAVITSGVYTPTLTNTTNLSGSTAYQLQYSRVGDVVSVSGRVGVDPSATGACLLGVSLPVASNFAASDDCGGVGASGNSDMAAIYGDASGDTALVSWVASDTSDHSMWVNFSYRVLL